MMPPAVTVLSSPDASPLASQPLPRLEDAPIAPRAPHATKELVGDVLESEHLSLRGDNSASDSEVSIKLR